VAAYHVLRELKGRESEASEDTDITLKGCVEVDVSNLRFANDVRQFRLVCDV